MAVNQWSPGAAKIEVFVIILIDHPATVALLDEERRSTNGLKGPHGRIYSTRKVLLGFRKKFRRFLAGDTLFEGHKNSFVQGYEAGMDF
jgi:hypothetical protein